MAVILLTLAAGWQRACAAEDVNANAGEVLMTERLRDGMRGALRNSPWKLIVLPGTESRSKASVVLPDGRTDIPLMLIEVFLRTQEHDPHAVIECKRIAGSDTHLCREYVVEGMDRFVREKYGGNHAIGFMVGYVLSGSPSESADGVNAYLRRVSRSDCLAPSDISDGTWQSLHARSKPSMPIRLHHAFLGFAGTSASRT
ncbi:hypothetical protein P3770_10075 [Pseudomonas aeruginosa]|nr:hypothetical protein [Pseudomonas aeruginosa]MDP5581535.1 hypothetical protein [Pseudomonas aeruginosa]